MRKIRTGPPGQGGGQDWPARTGRRAGLAGFYIRGRADATQVGKGVTSQTERMNLCAES